MQFYKHRVMKMRIRREKELIPLEKSKKVIRVSPRIKEKRNYPAIILLGLLATACLVYCVSIGLMMTGSKFFLVWGILAFFFGGWAALLANPRIYKKIPGWSRITVTLLVVVGVLSITALGTVIYTTAEDTAEPGAEYVIILGAQWRTDGPSTVIRYRLDTALDYLKSNPDTKVIVSGCQGFNEPISDAEGMAGYLMEAGISEERIFTEDQATNTYENLSYSSVFCEPDTDRVLVVTNDFHICRAVALGRAMGYEQLDGLAAPSHVSMLPQNLLRECLALVKEYLKGNL